MKKIIFLLTACFLLMSCKQDSPEIPVLPLETLDLQFKLFLLENFDLNSDGIISEDEAKLVKEINCPLKGILSLEGIQYFPNLEILDCSRNDVFTIDVSQNTALKNLNCDYCDIKVLDVSSNHALESLSCKSRSGMWGLLDSLILNPELKILDIEGHLLTSLDFSGHKYLKELYCQSTTLTNIDVSRSALEIVDCRGNQLNFLNINDCTSLKEITFYGNALSFVAKNCSSLERVYAVGLRQLDVSDSPLLKILECSLTGIQSFSLSNNPNLEDLRIGGQFALFDLSNNFQLVNLEINCYFEGNRSLDLSDRKKLKSFIYSGVAGKDLESINFTGCTSLEEVDIYHSYGGSMQSLNFSACSALTSLKCNRSSIRELNLEGCSNLTLLNCGANNLSELNLNHCPGLISLMCYANELAVLDIEACKMLTELNCSYNQLTNLRTNSENLSIIHCESNDLSELDIVNGSGLVQLFCNENNLSTLDLTGCLSLEELNCNSNKNLESLNLKDNKALKNLTCMGGSLTQLDVSNCSALSYLNCYANFLQPSLDVSNCLALKELICSSNPDLVELIVNRNNVIQSIQKDDYTQIVFAD